MGAGDRIEQTRNISDGAGGWMRREGQRGTIVSAKDATTINVEFDRWKDEDTTIPFTLEDALQRFDVIPSCGEQEEAKRIGNNQKRKREEEEKKENQKSKRISPSQVEAASVCVVCMSGSKDTVIAPCGHLCICNTC